MKRILIVFGMMLAALSVSAQTESPEQLIEKIVQVDKAQRAQVKDLVVLSEYIKGEEKDDGTFEEKVRFNKRISIKYLADTALMHEEYLSGIKEGKPMSDKDCQDAAKEDREKKKRRATPNISYPMLKPFYPEKREIYTIDYLGVAGERVDGYLCHYFKVTAKEPADTLLNGDYFFDTESLHLVRVTFSPSALVNRTMFKMSKMNMALNYLPTAEGYWIPTQFSFNMKAKAMWLISVPTAATETYSEPIINGGVPDSLFEVKDEE
ncbi:MAG: hypothetical protein IPH75_07365 [bacterium]|nr:hypothetical protein [bacterium]